MPVVDSTVLRDPRVSLRAKGLYNYLAAYDDLSHVTVDDMVKSGKEGRNAIHRALAELEQLGYLARERRVQANGRFGSVVYVLRDEPSAPQD